MCVPFVEEETMKRSRPTPAIVLVANDWEATEEPLRDVMVPPAPPASVPQLNVPPDQRSFSVETLHAERLAPKSDASVSDDAVVVAKYVRLETVRDVADAVVRVDCPVVESVLRKVAPETVRAVEEASPKVVFPVTSSVEEKVPVEPVIAPKLAMVE